MKYQLVHYNLIIVLTQTQLVLPKPRFM